MMFPSLGSRWGFSRSNSERARGRAAGAAEDYMKCKKRFGIYLACALLLNALPVPLLRQVPISVFFPLFF